MLSMQGALLHDIYHIGREDKISGLAISEHKPCQPAPDHIAQKFSGKHRKSSDEDIGTQNAKPYCKNISCSRNPAQKCKNCTSFIKTVMPLFNGFTLYPEVFFNPLPFTQVTNTIAAHSAEPVSGGSYQNSSIGICSVDDQESKQRFGTERHNRSCKKTGKE